MRESRGLAADRGEIAGVIGNEATERGFDQYGRPNRYSDELAMLIDALGLDE